MITAFDRVLIDVPDIDRAREDYRALLGAPEDGDTVDLSNVRVSLAQAPGAAKSRISTLGLLDTGLARATSELLSANGSGYELQRSHFREAAYRDITTDTGIFAVDHVVLQTRDADACIALYRDRLGLRLALDQTVPEFGGRMLFFRMGKMTLEVLQHLEKPPEQDSLWGITYQCRDIDATIEQLDRRGVQHSPIRQGRKPGTRVSTVKSHCLGLPTLLIGPD